MAKIVNQLTDIKTKMTEIDEVLKEQHNMINLILKVCIDYGYVSVEHKDGKVIYTVVSPTPPSDQTK